MVTTVRVDGLPVAPGTARAFYGLKAAFEKKFPGITLHVYSGYRSYADQEKIFRERYRAHAYSPYGDYRWWNGVRWGRVSGEGTVAIPGMSNHGNGRALDIRDSGRDAGVTIAGNARSNWIRANAGRYGFHPAGYGFGEPWHIELASGDPWSAAEVAGVESGQIDIQEDELSAEAEKKIDRILDIAYHMAFGKKGSWGDGPGGRVLREIHDKVSTVDETVEQLGDLRPGRAGKYSDYPGFKVIRDARSAAQRAEAEAKANGAAVEAMAKIISQQNGVPAKDILARVEKATREGVDAALKNLELTLSVDGDSPR